MMHLNNTGYNKTTKQSFEILNEDSAEAFEFFAAAASSGIEFAGNPGRGETGSDRQRSVHMASEDSGAGQPKRQRHFSLEDYNEMHYSGNESSNESFATASGVGNRNSGSTKNNSYGAGLNQQMHTSMQVDDPEQISFNGSEAASSSPPSTPSTSGLGQLSNAFMFPVSTIESKFNNCGIGSEHGVSFEVANPHIANGLLCELKQKLTAAIEERARDGSGILHQRSLQFPNNLLGEIASHVIQEASLEPCGLKGCLIFIYFEGENDCQYLNTLRCDPATHPTFELTLTLRQNQAKSRASWIPDIVKRNFSAMPNVMVSTSYRLVKRRKYRLNEIEELTRIQ